MGINDSLLKLAGAKRYKEGAVLLYENSRSADSMFVLLSGSIGAFENYQEIGSQQVAVYQPVSVLGEMTLFLGKPSSVTLVALSEVIALKINRENAHDVFARQPEIAFAIMESMCKQLYAALHPHEAAREAQAAKGSPAAAPQKNTTPAEQQATQPQPSAPSALFPEGHGTYLLPIDNEKAGYLYEQDITCPLCGHTFSSMTVIESRLKLERTDNDLRVHYKEIEPMYYDVVTCPACLYSALAGRFETAMRSRADSVNRVLQNFKAGTVIKTGKLRDTFAVFAGYYLALLCAPVCFEEHQLETAKLWLRLSRLYKDCKDEAMHLYAVRHALDDYRYAYQQFDFSDKVLQQICYLIGDLYEKTGDLDNAATFFFMAKSTAGGTRVMERQIEERLDALKEKRRQHE